MVAVNKLYILYTIILLVITIIIIIRGWVSLQCQRTIEPVTSIRNKFKSKKKKKKHLTHKKKINFFPPLIKPSQQNNIFYTSVHKKMEKIKEKRRE